jgi:rhomboid protease GluP
MSRTPPAITPARFPLTTAVMLAPTVVLTILNAHHPAIFVALRRDPPALLSGEWWRLISPVLLQPDPAWATVPVILLVAWLGVVAERTLGPRQTVLLYLAGALVGHAVGELWLPYRSGCSVAGCGLLGGVMGWLLRRGPTPARIGAIVLLVLAVVGTVLRDIHGPSVIAGALIGAARGGPRSQQL